MAALKLHQNALLELIPNTIVLTIALMTFTTSPRESNIGVGRATYDAAQEIRSDDITMAEGDALVRRFDHEFPDRFADKLYKYLSLAESEFPVASKMFEKSVMDQEYFHLLTNRFRSPHLWIHNNGGWQLRHPLRREG